MVFVGVCAGVMLAGRLQDQGGEWPGMRGWRLRVARY